MEKMEQNPKLEIKSYYLLINNKEIKINVIRDDILLGGTKQRALFDFIRNKDKYFDEFVYAGPATGFAQLALSIVCNQLGKKATLFLQAEKYQSYPIAKKSESFNANVKLHFQKLAIIQSEAKSYSSQNSRIYLIPFGLDCKEFTDILRQKIIEAIPVDFRPPTRLWVSVGSGTLLRILASIWTGTIFMPVKIGKKFWEDQFEADVWKRFGDGIDLHILEAKQRFAEPISTEIAPPYPSVSTYDAKIWQFVQIYGKDGDWIWNVACDLDFENISNDVPISDWNSANDFDEAIIKENFEKLGFPYKLFYKELYSDSKIIERFNNLKQFSFNNIENDVYSLRHEAFLNGYDLHFIGQHPITKEPMNSSLVIKEDVSFKFKYNHITDYFNEVNRMKAKRKDFEYSPFDLWQKNYSNVIKRAKERFEGKVNVYTLREAIFSFKCEATQFRPTLIKGFIEAYGSKRVLDFSSGWGDRLVGAMSAGVRYCGVDPNTALHPSYAKMIEFFKPYITPSVLSEENLRMYEINDLSENYQMICSPFETATISGKFDLVFTSPPYFDLETYSDESTQSIKNYCTVDDWFNKFLMVSIRKSWHLLIPNGHMCMIIDNIDGEADFILRMINEVNKFDDSIYEGLISYAESTKGRKIKSPKPIWIWKKIPKITQEYFPYNRLKIPDIFKIINKILQETILLYLVKNFDSEISLKVSAETNTEYYDIIVAVSIACKILKKNLTFIKPNSEPNDFIRILIMHGTKVTTQQNLNLSQLTKTKPLNIYSKDIENNFMEKFKEAINEPNMSNISFRDRINILYFGFENKELWAQIEAYLYKRSSIEKRKIDDILDKNVDSVVTIAKKPKNLNINPKFKIESIPLNVDNKEIKVFVVREDRLIGSTYRRALFDFMEKYGKDVEEFVYAGLATGLAQVALAFVCSELGKKLTLFLFAEKNKNYKMAAKSESYDKNIKVNLCHKAQFKDVEEEAKTYHSSNSNRYLIPFGLDFKEFTDILKNKLIEATPSKPPKRLWIAVGSGTLLRVMASIWTETIFMPVKILWKKICKEQGFEESILSRFGDTIPLNNLEAKQRFLDPISTELMPPYPSVSALDAKVWQFVKKYGKDEDWIWNVGYEDF